MTANTNVSNASGAAAGTHGKSDHAVSFTNVSLRFGQNPDLTIEDINLTIERGKFVSIIGPSGCGKTTLLNLTAGLLKPTDGKVHYDGLPVDGINTKVGYVTQDPNLLPWLRVGANIGLPLKLRGASRAEQAEQVKRWVDLVGLTGWENHFPRQLSGGMRKRASIARTLITNPNVVLMDEPFGPLDAITRMKLQQDLLRLAETSDATILFVTHDLSEAICLSDEVAVMSGAPGKLKAVLPVPIERPRNIIELPESPVYSQLAKQLWGIFNS